MPTTDFTTAAIDKETRRKLRHLAAQHETPIYTILSAVITHMWEHPDLIATVLRPYLQSSQESTHGRQN